MFKIFAIVNIAVFLAMGLDKFFARTGRWRVSEATLITVAALGAAPGLWFGMFFFRHKTQKKLFIAGAALALVTSIGIYVMCHGRGL
ncbi:MAG: DUF1294 domain-containing protein [Planctomycetota bacterium]